MRVLARRIFTKASLGDLASEVQRSCIYEVYSFPPRIEFEQV